MDGAVDPTEKNSPLGRRFAVGDLIVDAGRQAVFRDGVELSLPRLSFDLLVALARAAPDVVSNDELLARVWRGVIVGPETITQRVKLLRDAMGDDPRSPRYIQGVRGRGYRLVPIVCPVGPEPAYADSPVARSPLSSPAADGVPAPGSALWIRLSLIGAVLVAAATLSWWIASPGRHTPEAVDEPAAVVHVGLPPRTVAVLPFRRLGGDPADDYIGLGIAEMVLNRLAGSHTLTVIARSSSFAVAEHEADARTIGRLLGARFLVQGTVQRQGDLLRVSVQLSDAQTGRQLRGLAADRSLADLFAVQDEIAALVHDALEVTLGAASPGTQHLDAHLEYLQGLAALGRYRVGEAERAAHHFRRASKLDPGFAAAHAGEARALMQHAELLGQGHGAMTAVARPLLDQALALDPGLAEAYFARAFLTTDTAQAEADLRRGLELAPNHSEGHLAMAEWLGAQAYLAPADHAGARPGAQVELQSLLERAALLDPLRPRPRYLRALTDYLETGDDVALEAGLLAVLRIDPQYTQALNRLALLQASHRGRFAEGIVLIERALAADPDSAFSAQCALELYLAIGDDRAAADFAGAAFPERELARRLRAGEPVSPTELAGAGPSPIGMVHAMANVLAVRDAALHDREFTRASNTLRTRYCLPPGSRDTDCLRSPTLYTAIALGQLAIAAGERRRGEQLIESVLAQLEDTASALAPGAVPLLRAAALLSLGHQDEALAALAAAQAHGPSLSWWILLEHDQVFAAVRHTAAFRSVLALAQQHAANEHAALTALRGSGQVPHRPQAMP